MGKNGKLLNLNSDSPKYGNKSLVTKEQENELKRRKITFSFSYFKQIPNFQIGKAILTISMSSVKSFTFLALRVSHLLCFARSVLLLILALLVLAVLLHVLFQSRKM